MFANIVENHIRYRRERFGVSLPGRSNQTHCRHRCDVSSELCYPGAEPRSWIRHSLYGSA